MTDLAVIISKSGTRFTLIEDVEFHGDNIEGGCVVVPAGYRCDFASVPKLLWSWLPPLGHYAPAALLHDYLYDLQNEHGQTRSYVDGLFLAQMKKDGVGWRTRWTMYIAVRAFGWLYWAKP